MMPERALGTIIIGGRESLVEVVLPLAEVTGRLPVGGAADSAGRCFLLFPSLPLDPLEGSTGGAAADLLFCASGFKICSLKSFNAKEKS